jgi:hypothetical protein
MSDWNLVIAGRERHKELLREAERYRLVCQVLAERGTRDRGGWYRALAWLGRRLVAWGQRLQERYGAAAAAVHPAACQCQPTLANR